MNLIKRLMTRSTVILAALSLFFGAGGQAKANLILNPSFEAPAIGPNYAGDPPQSINDWSVTQGTLNGDVQLTPNFSTSGYTFNASDGRQWVDLTGTRDLGDGSSLHQSVNLAVGTYFLSFDHGLSGVFGETTTTVDVKVDGVSIGTDTYSNPVGVDMNWKNVTLGFSLNTAGPVDLSFVSLDPAGSNGHAVNGLDNVILTAATPEPTSLALLGVGIASMAGYGWRRRNAGATPIASL